MAKWKILFHIFYTVRSKRQHNLPAIIKTDKRCEEQEV